MTITAKKIAFILALYYLYISPILALYISSILAQYYAILCYIMLCYGSFFYEFWDTFFMSFGHSKMTSKYDKWGYFQLNFVHI